MDGRALWGVLRPAACVAVALTANSAGAMAQTAPTRWVLVYAGSPRSDIPHYTTSEFQRLLVAQDSSGRATRFLHTGAIFLQFRAPSGRAFTMHGSGGTPATGADWEAYLDSLFDAGGALSRLDSAVVADEQVVNQVPSSFPVAVMIPYPDSVSGSLAFKGRTYDLTTLAGQEALASAWVDAVTIRFRSAGYRAIWLDALYWYCEDIRGPDTVLVRTTADVVHRDHFRFLWIPWYRAHNWDRWSAMGFDEAWLQPNYFFHLDVPPARVDSAAQMALGAGMGMEIEFDRRLVSDPRFSVRLTPYLDALDRFPALRDRAVAIYEGHGAALLMASAQSDSLRALYRRYAEILR